jgi:hypothetical protein
VSLDVKCENEGWIQMTDSEQDPAVGSREHDSEPSSSIKDGAFID